MPEWLTRKVGPLPLWGYALVGAGAFFLYRRSKSASSATSATPTSAQYASTVPDNYTEPTASVTTPSGFNYTGPLSGLGALIPTGALSSTNGSTSGATNPPAVAAPPSAPAPQPASNPYSLPPVNSNAFPQTVLYGQYSPSDYTQIGTVTGGQYHGTNVTGGVPVYANLFGGFVQGFNESTLPSGTGLYIPSQFTGYETTKQ